MAVTLFETDDPLVTDFDPPLERVKLKAAGVGVGVGIGVGATYFTK